MYNRILLATDGSAPADRAADAAIELAGRFDAAVHAVHAMEVGELPADGDDPKGAVARQGAAAVERFVRRAEEAGVQTTGATLERGAPVHERLVDYATDANVDLIVMGTSGHTGLDRVLLGSVSEQTLRMAPVPVMTFPEDATLEALETIVVPTDGSEVARAAASHAVDLAVTADAAVHAIIVIDVSVLHDGAGQEMVLEALSEVGRAAVEDVVSMAEDAGVEDVATRIIQGQPSSTVVDYASEVDGSLIVVGTHGHRGLDRLLLGSVAERVIRTGETPVMGVHRWEREETTDDMGEMAVARSGPVPGS